MSTPRLRLSVQNATGARGVPTHADFRRWVARTITRDADITLRIVGEVEGRELNRVYRRKDTATNVLSFLYDMDPVVAGDIAIAAPVVSREARQQGKALDAHYAHLTVHGTLHLMGFAHAKVRDAAVMEAVETQILANLGYPDPYA